MPLRNRANNFITSAITLIWWSPLARCVQANQKLKGIEKQTEAADYNRKSFRGLYLPQLSVNASYMHLADPLYLSFNDYKAPIQNGLQGFATQVPAPMRPLFAPATRQGATSLCPRLAL